MAVSYSKLFALLVERGMKKKDFRSVTGLSYSTVSKLEKNENVMVDVLDRICTKLNCTIEEVIEIFPDENK